MSVRKIEVLARYDAVIIARVAIETDTVIPDVKSFLTLPSQLAQIYTVIGTNATDFPIQSIKYNIVPIGFRNFYSVILFLGPDVVIGPPGPPGPRGPIGSRGPLGLNGDDAGIGPTGPGAPIYSRIQPIDADTRLYYTFGESTGQIGNHGAAGASLNLTESVGADRRNINGFFDKSIAHLGAVSCLYSVTSAEGDAWSAFTMSFWSRSIAADMAARFGRANVSNVLVRGVYLNSTDTGVIFDGASVALSSPNVTYQWMHSALVYDPDVIDQSVIYYRDGVPYRTAAYSASGDPPVKWLLQFYGLAISDFRAEQIARSESYIRNMARRANRLDPITL